MPWVLLKSSPVATSASRLSVPWLDKPFCTLRASAPLVCRVPLPLSKSPRRVKEPSAKTGGGASGTFSRVPPVCALLGGGRGSGVGGRIGVSGGSGVSGTLRAALPMSPPRSFVRVALLIVRAWRPVCVIVPPSFFRLWALISRRGALSVPWRLSNAPSVVSKSSFPAFTRPLFCTSLLV